MGTWSSKINGNDSFQDIYQSFFDHYNQGQDPIDISNQIQVEFAELFNDVDDRNNALFALALSQWETKSLQPILFNRVRDIVDKGKDIAIWKALGSDETTLKRRQIELEKFLSKLSTERNKPKRRVRPKLNFHAIELLNIVAPDGGKEFEIVENYENDMYSSTSAMVNWKSGGNSVFYFHERGKFVTARWIDSQTLEIEHDSAITFSQKNEEFYFLGDQGLIKYVPK